MPPRLSALFCCLYFFLHISLPGLGQTAPLLRLGQARRASLGSVLTVRGVVANGPELGGVRYLLDQTAGLAAYSTAPAFVALQPGDSVELQGTLKNYNGLLELTTITRARRLAQRRPLPLHEVAFADLASVYEEAFESRLVRITGVPFLTSMNGVAVRVLAGSTSYLLGGQRGAVLRVPAASGGTQGLVGAPAPTGEFTVIGLMGQYAPNGHGSYQLLPRTYADLEVGHGKPVVVGVPVALETSPQTVKLQFTTLNPGDTRIDFGRDGELSSVVTNAALTTTHVITLTNLRPGTTYHVRASSTNAAGNSLSAVVLIATDSRRRSAASAGEPLEKAQAPKN
ncbi:hypothetical protein [Hymenobacter sp. BT190]|uniref:hypothetical protein n=1 Tax=Hymenobacter sp. BT190 TaxID=2763505 RepID=UPI00165103C0|nr:hypothetical protein [Hymenobacter sp. BT190]MBC6698576.1 hypothetical protein [Hymenobacter sp. BT190]